MRNNSYIELQEKLFRFDTTHIPEDIWNEIFKLLDDKDLIKLGGVSKHFKKLTGMEKFWKILVDKLPLINKELVLKIARIEDLSLKDAYLSFMPKKRQYDYKKKYKANLHTPNVTYKNSKSEFDWETFQFELSTWDVFCHFAATGNQKQLDDFLSNRFNKVTATLDEFGYDDEYTLDLFQGKKFQDFEKALIYSLKNTIYPDAFKKIISALNKVDVDYIGNQSKQDFLKNFLLEKYRWILLECIQHKALPEIISDQHLIFYIIKNDIENKYSLIDFFMAFDTDLLKAQFQGINLIQYAFWNAFSNKAIPEQSKYYLNIAKYLLINGKIFDPDQNNTKFSSFEAFLHLEKNSVEIEKYIIFFNLDKYPNALNKAIQYKNDAAIDYLAKQFPYLWHPLESPGHIPYALYVDYKKRQDKYKKTYNPNLEVPQIIPYQNSIFSFNNDWNNLKRFAANGSETQMYLFLYNQLKNIEAYYKDEPSRTDGIIDYYFLKLFKGRKFEDVIPVLIYSLNNQENSLAFKQIINFIFISEYHFGDISSKEFKNNFLADQNRWLLLKCIQHDVLPKLNDTKHPMYFFYKEINKSDSLKEFFLAYHPEFLEEMEDNLQKNIGVKNQLTQSQLSS